MGGDFVRGGFCPTTNHLIFGGDSVRGGIMSGILNVRVFKHDTQITDTDYHEMLAMRSFIFIFGGRIACTNHLAYQTLHSNQVKSRSHVTLNVFFVKDILSVVFRSVLVD